MAPVAGRPFLEYVLDQLDRAGVQNLTLALGYRSEVIEQHFGDRYRGVRIRYSVEEEPLDTGGAILAAVADADVGSEPVLVLNGDTFLKVDYRALFAWYEKRPSSIAMVLRHVSNVERFGSVVLVDDTVTRFEEKGQIGPGLINAGIYIIKPEIFSAIGLQGRFSFETEVLQKHCSLLKPRAFVCDDYFIDIGIPEEYDRAQDELAARCLE